MSDTVKVDPAAVAAFGTQHTQIAAQVAGSAAADVAGSLASAVPTFGLIGQQFLLAFAGAQMTFLESSGEVAAVHGSIGAAALEGAASYSATEISNAATIASSVL